MEDDEGGFRGPQPRGRASARGTGSHSRAAGTLRDWQELLSQTIATIMQALSYHDDAASRHAYALYDMSLAHARHAGFYTSLVGGEEVPGRFPPWPMASLEMHYPLPMHPAGGLGAGLGPSRGQAPAPPPQVPPQGGAMQQGSPVGGLAASSAMEVVEVGAAPTPLPLIGTVANDRGKAPMEEEVAPLAPPAFRPYFPFSEGNWEDKPTSVEPKRLTARQASGGWKGDGGGPSTGGRQAGKAREPKGHGAKGPDATEEDADEDINRGEAEAASQEKGKEVAPQARREKGKTPPAKRGRARKVKTEGEEEGKTNEFGEDRKEDTQKRSITKGQSSNGDEKGGKKEEGGKEKGSTSTSTKVKAKKAPLTQTGEPSKTPEKANSEAVLALPAPEGNVVKKEKIGNSEDGGKKKRTSEGGGGSGSGRALQEEADGSKEAGGQAEAANEDKTGEGGNDGEVADAAKGERGKGKVKEEKTSNKKRLQENKGDPSSAAQGKPKKARKDREANP